MSEALLTCLVIAVHADLINLGEGCDHKTVNSKAHISKCKLLQEVVIAIKLTTRRIDHLVIDDRQTLIQLIEVICLVSQHNIRHLTIGKTGHICTETRHSKDHRYTSRRQLVLVDRINERLLRLLNCNSGQINVFDFSHMDLIGYSKFLFLFIGKVKVSTHASLINQNIDNLFLQLCLLLFLGLFFYYFSSRSSLFGLILFSRSLLSRFSSGSLLSGSFASLQNLRVLSSTIQSIHNTNHLLRISRTRDLDLLSDFNLSIHVSQILIRITHGIISHLILHLNLFIMVQISSIDNHT